MALDKDTIQIALQVLGQQGLDNLAKSTENYKRLLEALHQEYARGNIDVDEWLRRTNDLTAAMHQQQAALDQLRTAGGSAIGEFASKYRGEILNLGRITQDFAQGGVGGILNNIEGLLQRFPALAGVGTILATALWAAWPQIEKWFGNFGEQAGKTKEQLKEIEAEIKKVHEEFEKLKNAPTDYEKQAAEGIGLFLKERPNAARASGAVAESIRKGDFNLLPPEYQAILRKINPAAGGSDAELAQQAEAETRPLRGESGAVYRQRVEARAQRLREGRRTAMLQASPALAEKIVADAAKAGPEGDLARKMLREATAGRPEFKELGYYTPERIKAEEEEREAEGNPAEESGRAASAAIKQREKRAKEAANAKEKRDRLTEQLNVQGQEGYQLYLKQVEDNKRDDEREAARKKREAAQKAREATAAQKAARKASLEAQANELLAHGPEIVGEFYGPQKAMMAAGANTAEVNEIKERTIKNLQEGQTPYAALLDAFREVAEMSARNARDSRRFAGQLYGLRNQARTSTQPFHDTGSY